jgi:hypothetical protein
VTDAAGRFFKVLDEPPLAACAVCCAVIVDDDEGANRRQHLAWHLALEANA